ncbi:aspartyl-trna synthetase [Moniliophthora roreri]|nr:aspartyl-trna synthetase [Moniliophthora roreri]
MRPRCLANQYLLPFSTSSRSFGPIFIVTSSMVTPSPSAFLSFLFRSLTTPTPCIPFLLINSNT